MIFFINSWPVLYDKTENKAEKIQTTGYSIFYSRYIGLDPASTVYPQKISGMSGIPRKVFEI